MPARPHRLANAHIGIAPKAVCKPYGHVKKAAAVVSDRDGGLIWAAKG